MNLLLLAFVPYSPGLEAAAILCLIVGVVLMGIEIFTPGFSVPGILGTILLLAGLIMGANSLPEALVMILILLVVITVMLIIMMVLANQGKLDRSPIVLSQRSSREDGYLSTQDLEYFIGKEGRTLTVLRPSGTVDMDGVRLDVVTRGEYIDKDVPIVVLKVEGRRIVVKALEK